MAVRLRLHARAGRAYGGRAQGAGRGGRPLPRRQGGARPRDRGAGSGAQARCRASFGVCAAAFRRGSSPRHLELLQQPALPRKRHQLQHADSVHVLLQLGRGRMRGLSRFRPCDRSGLGLGDSRRKTHAAPGRHQADPDAGLERKPGRPDAPRRSRRHSARHALEQADRGAAALGDRRRTGMERAVEQAVVRHPAFLRLSGEQGVQDAHPGAAVQVPQLYRMSGL